MEGARKRYIVTREPIGTANKHFQDLSSQLNGIESVLQIIQTLVQSLSDKSNSTDHKICKIFEHSTKTTNHVIEIDKKIQSLTIKMDRRERRLRRRNKVNRTEKNCQTEYNISVKPVESLQDQSKTNHLSEPKSNLEHLKASENNTNESEVVDDENLQNSDFNEDAKEMENIGLSTKEAETPAVIINTRSKNERSNDITDSSLLVTLNKEQDFPDGSWLGDTQDSNKRVRVCITPSDLETLIQTFNSPEKLALALLDKLFTREILAASNLTGKGRHNKKRLDPLLIYGIYSHLRYVHNISDSDWSRIKNNMEAKCRFLWRRKMKPKLPQPQNQQNSPEQQLNKQQQHSLVGWSNEVLIAGRGPEDTENIVLYPLYQVDSNQLIQVSGLQSNEKAQHITEASLSETVEMVEARSRIESINDATEHVVELVRNPSSSKQSIEQRHSHHEHSEINHQTLTLSGGDLIMTDLGEVISITNQEDVDCMMVSSVDYL